MKLAEISKMQDTMMEAAGDDATQRLTALEVISGLLEFWAREEESVYYDDPYSQCAPSECVGLVLDKWKHAQDKLYEEVQKAKRAYEEEMNYCTTAEDYDAAMAEAMAERN